MKRFLAAALMLALVLPLPALGAEADAGFSDVPSDDWFAPYVEVCVEEGLMQGTGDGTFAPERELTLPEAIVLAARLYARLQGLEDIPTAGEMPEDPHDMLLFYDEQGTQIGNLEDIAITNILGNPLFVGMKPEFLAKVDSSKPLTMVIDVGFWANTFEPFSQLKDGPHTYVGTYGELDFKSGSLHQGYWFPFDKETDDLQINIEFLGCFIDWNGETYRGLVQLQNSGSGWYKDAFLYLLSVEDLTLEGADHDTMPEEADFSWLEREPCFRGDLAELLYQLLPVEELSPLSLRQPPDATEEWALALYWAGIFTGVDEAGTFHSQGHLTRAEAAAILARVIRPDLRKSAPAEERSPEELVRLEVQHGSFGRIESKYTLDLSENSLTAWYSGYFQDADDREETVALTGEAVEAFRQSPAAESLLGWGEVYYNMNVMDGHQWGMTLTFSDGETREIHGSNAYPEGWDLVYDALLALTGQNVMDVRSNWLEH